MMKETFLVFMIVFIAVITLLQAIDHDKILIQLQQLKTSANIEFHIPDTPFLVKYKTKKVLCEELGFPEQKECYTSEVESMHFGKITIYRSSHVTGTKDLDEVSKEFWSKFEATAIKFFNALEAQSEEQPVPTG